MQKSTLKKIGKRTLQIGLPIVVLASLLYKLRDWGDWNGLLAHAHEWNPWLLVVASGLHYLARTLDLVRSHRKVGAAP